MDSSHPIATARRRGIQAVTELVIERAVALVLCGTLILIVASVLFPVGTILLFSAIICIATWPIRQLVFRVVHRNSLAATALVLIALLITLVPIGIAAWVDITSFQQTGRSLERQIGDAKIVEHIRYEAERYACGVKLTEIAQNCPNAPFLYEIPVIGETIRTIIQPYARNLLEQMTAKNVVDLFTLASTVLTLLPTSEHSVEVASAAARLVASSLVTVIAIFCVTTWFWAVGGNIGMVMVDLSRHIAGVPAVNALENAARTVRGIAAAIVGTAAFHVLVFIGGFAWLGYPINLNAMIVVFLASATQFGIVPLILAPLIPAIVLPQFGMSDASLPGWVLFAIMFPGTLLVRWWIVHLSYPFPGLLLLIGVTGGVATFGFPGVLIGPAVLAVSLELLKHWGSQARMDTNFARAEANPMAPHSIQRSGGAALF